MKPQHIKAPFLPYASLRQKAENFLARYHPSLTAPVPIETIIDNEFRINIIPVPGIRENADVDGVLSRDFQDIWVDENVYENNPHRYRFTLAHEIGHMILHGEIYKALHFRSFADWKEGVPRQFDGQQYGYFESQANSFAGLVLVPTDTLRKIFPAAWQKVKKLLAPQNIPADPDSPVTRRYVASIIAEDFDVSPDTVEIRLEREKIWEGAAPAMTGQQLIQKP